MEASSWPSFTLLGQSWGSVLLGLEAISYLTPEVCFLRLYVPRGSKQLGRER